MTAIEFTRWFLALYFAGVASFYTLRIILLRKRSGESPVFTGRPGTLHFATHLTFRIFRVAILAICAARIPWPGLDTYLIPFEPLWHPFVLMLGNTLLVLSFAAVVGVHMYMGKNWRSGTRTEDRTAFMTDGPFAVSQNPMMLCVAIAQFGFFLALPSVFTLLCLFVGIWAITAQTKVERTILRQRFGDTYERYAESTPRWLFFR